VGPSTPTLGEVAKIAPHEAAGTSLDGAHSARCKDLSDDTCGLNRVEA
jgi:hypothetical protein